MGNFRDTLGRLDPASLVVRAAEEQRALEERQAQAAVRAQAYRKAMFAAIRARASVASVRESATLNAATDKGAYRA